MTVEVSLSGTFLLEETSMFNPEKLSSHPDVYNVTDKTLTLRYEFRIKLFHAWKSKHGTKAVRKLLTDNGFTEDLVGPNYHLTVAGTFRNGGFPVPRGLEYRKDETLPEISPLVVSGKFTYSNEGGNWTIDPTPAFLSELSVQYGNKPLEEIIEDFCIDERDVGSRRMLRIDKILKNKSSIDIPSANNTDSQEQPSESGPETNSQESALSDSEAEKINGYVQYAFEGHPYVEKVTLYDVILRDSFYNEASFLFGLDIDEILSVYEITPMYLPEKVKRRIHEKLALWEKNNSAIPPLSEQLLRIRKRHLNTVNQLVISGFKEIGKAYARMGIRERRKCCQMLSDLPHDVSGIYTVQRILELTGVPRSTYYALLNDEEYGKFLEKREARDEDDIEVVREVMAYKGFEKGLRQIYMLMPKVTGKSFSIYRIRRLMNKYGIRTTIRRPSRNRKAMKELIARNRKANLLMRRFRMHRPNEVRLTDVTYLDYGNELRAYGSASIDPVTGRLICFIVSETNDLQLALDTLEAMEEHPAKSGAILHSDQGMLYMTDDFQAAVVEKELNQSMSRRGNCWDNAPQESFFGHFKDECHYRECKTLEELRSMISSYGIYYNTERGMWDKGRMTPEEYEEYLENMDEMQWQKHLAEEEERYLKMKEASAAKAVEEARQYRDEIQEKLEELKR